VGDASIGGIRFVLPAGQDAQQLSQFSVYFRVGIHGSADLSAQRFTVLRP
jgi:hypothetical protein